MAIEPKYFELSEEDLARLDDQRKWVVDNYGDLVKSESVEGKLRLLDAVLREKRIEPDETWKLQSLGVVLGDALAQKLGLKWKTIEDEHGRDPALVLQNTTLKIFPLSMISKRIERGEEVDVIGLFGMTCGHVIEIAKKLK